ncbi:MAG TPA: HAMP domain-containing sensor histidine kinase, partial [Flavisolibacter sp.]
FYELLRQMSAFRLEQPGPVTPPKTRINEFKALHETVENLLQSNISSYRSQKEFIENAAHELQTPLAITIGKLEALTQQSQFSGQELQLVTSAMDNLQRLVRLNRSLLLISRIHNRQFTSEAGINLNELTRKILGDFSDQASYQDIKITLMETGACRAEMNEDLAHILITNLVKNALTHNHKGGFIKVEMLDHGLRIQNSGEEKSLDAAAIFTRFYHASNTGRSTGLGLSIVKAICDLYHFKIVYRHENAHIFILDFPEQKHKHQADS